ncbi:MAG: hypothetical protein H7281_15550 [Bacteriovorax sp.]|nr:hypothetical protein [Bacteriovorax sp.]
MKFFTLIIFSLALNSPAFAEESSRCFNAIQNHIQEAITHNKKVAPIYNELSNGKSAKLSWALISGEKTSALLIKKIESESKIYHEKGIPLLCEELEDMKNVPVFQERLPEELRPVEFFAYDQKKINRKIKILMENDQFDLAYEAIANDLRKLEEYPNQLCLTKHFLESIARTLLLSSKHREDAKRLGLADPKNLIKKFITLQRRALPFNRYLDSQAFPLQKDGLLIYCQDVPAIEWK